MNLLCAKMVYAPPTNRSLCELYSPLPDVLCATGVGQFVASFDRGATWTELNRSVLGTRVVSAVECDDVALLFIAGKSGTEVWTGVFGQDDWQPVSRIPDSSFLQVGFSEYKTIFVALRQGDYLDIQASVDTGKTWDSTLRIPFPGTLTHFEVNSLGVGVVIALAECPAFESRIMTIDAMSGRVRAT